MAAGRAVNAKSLAALGVDRLAELLAEIARDDGNVKDRLLLALAAEKGPGDAAARISKRLAAVARAKSPVSGKAKAALAKDLETQRRAIAELVAPADPAEGFELARRLADLEPDVLGRVAGDTDGAVAKVFAAAAADLAALGPESGRDPVALAEEVFEPMRSDWRLARHALIPKLETALGEAGAARLKELFEELAGAPGDEADPNDPEAAGRAEFTAFVRRVSSREGLKRVADLRGDPDGYAAQFREDERARTPVANGLAERFLAAGRPEDALRLLDGAEAATDDGRARAGEDRLATERWEDLRIDALDAAGRGDEAQALRHAVFARRFSAGHLRAWLAKLPEFEDIEAEERELAFVARQAPPDEALAFLLDWPARAAAAELLAAQCARRLADLPDALVARAADELAAEFPLAATVALREPVERDARADTAASMKRVERRLEECALLAEAVSDFGVLGDHEAFVDGLVRRYPIDEE